MVRLSNSKSTSLVRQVPRSIWAQKSTRFVAGISKIKTGVAKLIGLVARIPRDHVALQFNDSFTFHPVDNEQLIAYSKTRVGPEINDIIVVVVNLDHVYPQAGWLDLDAEALNLEPGARYGMNDLLTAARFEWRGTHNFVKLDPHGVPCHIFALESPS